jgi:hypothetical protein
MLHVSTCTNQTDFITCFIEAQPIIIKVKHFMRKLVEQEQLKVIAY